MLRNHQVLHCAPAQLQGTYYEARATDIDPTNRVVTCRKEFCDVSRGAPGWTEQSPNYQEHSLR